MALTFQDEIHLQRALSLAQEAAASASPNPAVGCMLTREDVVLGEGAHFYDRRDHAEIAALKQAEALGHDVRGATAYVTLEPCAHHGRTGPCAEALVGVGIARCVVATVDPNPLVSGAGLAKMRSAGVEVVLVEATHALAERARRLNDAFACFIQRGRPFVTLKAALSVDGMIAPAVARRMSVAPHWITGSAARADAQRLRHGNDAILVGIGTVLADDPSLTDRSGLGRRRPLLRVVLDRHLRTPVDSALVASADGDVLLLASEFAAAERESELVARGVEVVRLPSAAGDVDGLLDLDAVFAELGRREIISLLVEGGSQVNRALLRNDLVDRVVLYFAEGELGVDAVPFAAGGDSPYELQRRLSGVTRAAFASDVGARGDDVRVAGYLHDPWVGIGLG
jgi:diaminohydroxyphosphoribosylaminopyrimidine deaminase/5-amino-6-(5-phosphoribosylamino)uracil reductase